MNLFGQLIGVLRAGGAAMAMADWRSPDEYKEVLQFDTPGFAWEFLRRNLEFRQDHAGLSRAASKGRGTPKEHDAFALRWGIRFRRGCGMHADMDTLRFAKHRLPYRASVTARQSGVAIATQRHALALSTPAGRACHSRFRQRVTAANPSI